MRTLRSGSLSGSSSARHIWREASRLFGYAGNLVRLSQTASERQDGKATSPWEGATKGRSSGPVIPTSAAGLLAAAATVDQNRWTVTQPDDLARAKAQAQRTSKSNDSVLSLTPQQAPRRCSRLKALVCYESASAIPHPQRLRRISRCERMSRSIRRRWKRQSGCCASLMALRAS